MPPDRTHTSIHLSGVGEARLPPEFKDILHTGTEVVVIDAGMRADEALSALSDGKALVVAGGEFSDLKILMWYVMRFRQRLDGSHCEGRALADARARQTNIKRALHRLLVTVRKDEIVGVAGVPDTEGISEWFSWEQEGDQLYVIPVRRLLRILTDIRRSREGMEIKALKRKLVVLPHVYVPFDQSVISLLDRHMVINPGDRVLDLGTGSGVLAFLAANRGAAHVVATDVSHHAVRNARLNARCLGLDGTVEVRDSGDLFEPAPERFDVVIFNPPWVDGTPKNPYEVGIYDEGARVARDFICQVGGHLNPTGRVYLLYSDSGQKGDECPVLKLKLLAEEKGMRVSSDCWISRRSRLTGSRERVHLLEITPGGSPLGPRAQLG